MVASTRGDRPSARTWSRRAAQLSAVPIFGAVAHTTRRSSRSPAWTGTATAVDAVVQAVARELQKCHARALLRPARPRAPRRCRRRRTAWPGQARAAAAHAQRMAERDRAAVRVDM